MAKGIKWKLGPLWNFFKVFAGDIPTPLKKQMAVRYSAYVRRRYAKQGNGTWAKLAPSTIKRRRNGSSTILRDTGTLLAALTIGGPGNITKHIKGGVIFGFGGGNHSSGKSIRQIAIIHDQGKGVVKREILAEPDSKLIKAFEADTKRAIKKAFR